MTVKKQYISEKINLSCVAAAYCLTIAEKINKQQKLLFEVAQMFMADKTSSSHYKYIQELQKIIFKKT